MVQGGCGQYRVGIRLEKQAGSGPCFPNARGRHQPCVPQTMRGNLWEAAGQGCGVISALTYNVSTCWGSVHTMTPASLAWRVRLGGE